MLYLYQISQSENQGLDTYDSAVVIAASEEIARNTHPASGHLGYAWDGERWVYDASWGSRAGGEYIDFSWTSPDFVKVKFLGVASSDVEPGVVIASYNGG